MIFERPYCISYVIWGKPSSLPLKPNPQKRPSSLSLTNDPQESCPSKTLNTQKIPAEIYSTGIFLY